MGTIMDDAVGFLVGPELVRPEASSATAVASAVAKNAAAAPAARATPAAGGDGTGGGAGLEGRAKDVEAGALRAEEVRGDFSLSGNATPLALFVVEGRVPTTYCVD